MNALVTATVAAMGLQGGEDPRPVPMARPVAVATRRGAAEIAVDGSLIDWPTLPVIVLSDPRQISGTALGARRDARDLSATAFLLWDEQNLWFAAQVQDDWHRQLDPRTMMLQETPVADCIVLTFDPHRDTRALGPDPGRREDVEFWLGDEESQSLLAWDRLRGSARLLEDGQMVVSHDRVQGVTSYEARIPWTAVLPYGQRAAAGTVFDFQIVVNDFDESTDPMPQTRIGWTFGCGPVVDPCLFGTVQLVADTGELKGGMPLFPDRLHLPLADAIDPGHWRKFQRELAAQPPALHDGWRAPAATGGIARLALLEVLERATERFPRVDHVEFCQRVHRRMNRESLGIDRTGLPSFWNLQLDAVAVAADRQPPPGSARLFRVPQCGWLVRGASHSFLVDAAGAGLEDRLWGGAGLVLVTEPLDMTRRNDQLLVRVAASETERRFLTHIAFHLPVVPMGEMPLVLPQESYGEPGGIRVRTLGRVRADGQVPFALGYDVELPGGPRLLIVSAATQPEEIPADVVYDAMILSPRNPLAVAVARRAAARVVLIDDGFLCARLPNVRRTTLRELHALQKAVLPNPSVLLAPGESWEIKCDH